MKRCSSTGSAEDVEVSPRLDRVAPFSPSRDQSSNNFREQLKHFTLAYVGLT